MSLRSSNFDEEVRDTQKSDLTESSSEIVVEFETPGEEEFLTWEASEWWRDFRNQIAHGRMISEVKSRYDEGFVAINEETGDILAHAHSQHELTQSLLSLDYDPETTLILDV